jgi:competence protein ComEA
MIEKGAEGTDAEIQVVVDYLVKYFGRDSKLNVNKATVKDLETALKLSPKEAEAIVQYREKNGSFREWGDLVRVPDLDGKKLEAKKAEIGF